MNEPFYLGISILESNKMLIYNFWYDYVKPKYGEKAKLCYTDIGSFIVYMKTDDMISIKILQKMLKLDAILHDELDKLDRMKN